MENTTIYGLLLKHKVKGYFRYVDDILVMYKEDNTDIQGVPGGTDLTSGECSLGQTIPI
jgi:hypothetical protein